MFHGMIYCAMGANYSTTCWTSKMRFRHRLASLFRMRNVSAARARNKFYTIAWIMQTASSGWCTFSPARLNVHALNTFFHLSRNGHSCNFNFSALTVNTCLWMKFIRAPDHRACLWPRVNASLVNGFRLIFGIVFVQYACLIHSLVTLSSIIQCKICFVTQKRKMLHWFSPFPSESPVRARLLLFALGSFHKSSEAERLSNRWYLKLESQKCFKAMWWKIWWIGFSQIIYE